MYVLSAQYQTALQLNSDQCVTSIELKSGQFSQVCESQNKVKEGLNIQPQFVRCIVLCLLDVLVETLDITL